MRLNKYFSGYFYIPLILLSLTGVLSGCAYTFNPGTTGNAKTLFIANIINVSGGGPPYMTQVLTEKLKSYYQQNSNLSIVNSNGDWAINGEIAGYQIKPIAPQQNQQAGGNRLTITVNITFDNKLDHDKDFKQAFSFYADFEAGQLISNVQDELLDIIFDQIVFDIYTKTTSDW